MINLEDINTKENLIQDFYTWLFDDNNIIDKSVDLEKEVDISLAPYYTDPYIYYPKQIANFFNTKAMQRLGRISQLALANDIYPNIYHSRLEHSKGVYNRKLEEFLYHFQDSNWRKYIEENHLKIYLLADLIKMAGHDIGHLPLSHLMEIEIFSYRGAHEDLGKHIMLEDPEIQNVLSKISPKLPDILNDLYNKHIMNFKEHDESSFDVDRCDYVSRDYLYFGLPIHLPYSHYESVSVELDSYGKPIENNDGSIKTSSNSKRKIDVYDEKQLHIIERLLEKRLEGYHLIYSAPLVFAHEKTINAFFNAFKSNSQDFNTDLKTLINDFKNKGIDNIDLDKLLEWDDIKLYSEIINIAETHPDSNVRDLATMTIPNMEAFLNMVYSHLDLKNHSKQDLSTQDLGFLQKVKSLIRANSKLGKNLKNPNYTDENTIFFDEPTSKVLQHRLQQIMPNSTSDTSIVNTHLISKKAYNTDEPIYIKDINGKIYELSKHPKRKCDWNNVSINLHSSFAYIPYLRFCGISEDIISKLQNISTGISTYSIPKETYFPQVSMQPLQVENNLETYFSRFDTDTSSELDISSDER